MQKWTLVVSFLASLGLIAGCAGVDGDSNPADPGPRTSGLALSSDTLADTDVARMQFDVTGVGNVDIMSATENQMITRSRTGDIQQSLGFSALFGQ